MVEDFKNDKGKGKKREKATGDISRGTINYHAGVAADRLEARRAQEQARYFRDGNIDGCS